MSMSGVSMAVLAREARSEAGTAAGTLGFYGNVCRAGRCRTDGSRWLQCLDRAGTRNFLAEPSTLNRPRRSCSAMRCLAARSEVEPKLRKALSPREAVKSAPRCLRRLPRHRPEHRLR